MEFLIDDKTDIDKLGFGSGACYGRLRRFYDKRTERAQNEGEQGFVDCRNLCGFSGVNAVNRVVVRELGCRQICRICQVGAVYCVGFADYNRRQDALRRYKRRKQGKESNAARRRVGQHCCKAVDGYSAVGASGGYVDRCLVNRLYSKRHCRQ